MINNGYYYILNRIFDVAREYFDVSSGVEYDLIIEDGYIAVTTFAIFLGMVGIILLNIQLHNKCTLLLTGYGAVMMLSYGRGRVTKQMRYILPAMAAVAVLLASMAAFLIPEGRYTRIIPSYETALTVRYTPYSLEPVYLKAFTGLQYIGTSWTEAEPEWPGDGNMESSLRSRYDAFREESGSARQGCGIMEVERAGAEDTFEYRPYYTDYHNIERKDDTLVYHYYPDNGETVLSSDEEPNEGYLDVPESCEAAIRQVCEEAGFGGTEREIAG